MVKTTSVMVFPVIRLVMFTLRKMERLPVIRAAEVPPEQLSTMSPILSVMPSVCTIGGTAVESQVRIVCALARLKAPPIKKREKQGYNRRDIIKLCKECSKKRQSFHLS